MTVTLLEVWRAARARSVPFASESAGHLTLAAAEEIAVVPRRAALSTIELTADGLVRVRGGEACSAECAETELRELLRLLLDVASSPGAALVRAAGRAATGNLVGLATELEKALIPVNRAAARRALLRLYRETVRAVSGGRLAPAPAPPGLLAPDPRIAPPSAPAFDGASRAEPRVEAEPMAEPAEAEPVAEPAEPRAEAERAVPREPDVLTRPETRLARRSSGPPAPAIAWVESELAFTGPAPGTSAQEDTDRTERAPMVEEISEPDAEALEPIEAIDLLELLPDASESFLGGDADPLGAGILEEQAAIDDSVFGFDLVEDALDVTFDPAVFETGWLEPAIPVESYPGLPAQKSDVRELVVGFEVAGPINEAELRRELKALAGVDHTPGPPADLGVRSRLTR